MRTKETKKRKNKHGKLIQNIFNLFCYFHLISSCSWGIPQIIQILRLETTVGKKNLPITLLPKTIPALLPWVKKSEKHPINLRCFMTQLLIKTTSMMVRMPTASKIMGAICDFWQVSRMKLKKVIRILIIFRTILCFKTKIINSLRPLLTRIIKLIFPVPLKLKVKMMGRILSSLCLMQNERIFS